MAVATSTALLIATGVAAAGAGVQASAAHQTKKTAKHARERAMLRSSEIEQSAEDRIKADKIAARKEKIQRSIGVSRNLNLFGGSLNDRAQVARKVLTGQ